jgi:hypothetical protein
MKQVGLVLILLLSMMHNALAIASEAEANLTHSRWIGGIAAPVFFTQYDQQAINAIAATPKVSQIIISYPPALKPLALEIAQQIRAKSRAKVKLTEIALTDTSTVHYRHDAVIVTSYFR